MSDASIFLYSDLRFRTVGESQVQLSASARRVLDEAHRGLTEHPDAQLVACLCGTAASHDVRVSIADRHGLPLGLVLCRRCGLIRVNPQPSHEQLRWFYAQVYRGLYGPFASDDDALFEGKRWKGALVLDALSKAALELPPGPVVDMGCGGGWTLAAFSQPGQACIGFDFDERLLAIGRKRGLDLRLGGIERASQEQLRAGLLIVGHVLEHVLDPEGELRALRPLLADGGLLYLEVPHTRRIGGSGLGCDSLRYWQRAHLWDFQRSHLTALAQRSGYLVVWAAEDENSIFALCRVDDGGSRPADWPLVGATVEAQLLGFEARFQSRPRRLAAAARAAYGKRAGQVRRLLRRGGTAP